MRLLIPLFSPPTGTWGSLTRVLAVADSARAAGHEVAFAAASGLLEKLRKKGYRVYQTPRSTFLGLPPVVADPLSARSQRASLPVPSGRSVGNIWLVLLVMGAGRVGFLRKLVAAQLEAVRDFRPDMLFTELDPGAFVVSRVTGLPIAMTYSTVAEEGEGSLPWRLVNRCLRNVLSHFGRRALTPHELCFAPEVLKIIPSVPELEDADETRKDIVYVGSLLSPVQDAGDDLQLQTDCKNVFAYVGTGSISLEVLEEVLPEVFPSGGGYCCHVGAQSISEPYQLGAVQFSSYVPAEKLLPHCAFTITHGGHNTIIQSLLSGVPLIVLPGPIFERRYNARKVQDAGCGIMGEVSEFDASWLRRSMRRRLAMAEEASRIGERIASFGGADAAVRALEHFSS